MTAVEEWKTMIQEIVLHHRPYKEDTGIFFCREECCDDFYPCDTVVRAITVAQMMRIDLELNY